MIHTKPRNVVNKFQDIEVNEKNMLREWKKIGTKWQKSENH